MKKIVTLFLTGIMIASLSACGSDAGEASGTSQPSPAESVTDSTEDSVIAEEGEITPDGGNEEEESDSVSESETSEQEGKTLVVYYSATGNTKEVAEYIASATGGELFELVPAVPYSSADLDWTDDGSRVSIEYGDPSKREMELEASTVENWEDYETVYIGFPIWWHIAAWPVDAFVKANDFTGKTIIPFCTSSSSGLGESGELLAEMAGTGDWLEGMRFRSDVSEESVMEWLEGLGE